MSIAFLVVLTAMTISLKAQPGSNNFAQPQEIIGRRYHPFMDVVIREYEASFGYTFDGILDRFLLPEYSRTVLYDSLPAGMYLITLSNQTVKFIKQ